MSKRKRSGGLTGGTGDTNPQFMSFSVVQTGNDAASSGSVQPPVSLSTGEKMAMEVLSVFVEDAQSPVNAASTLVFTLATKNFSTTQPTLGIGDATVLTHYIRGSAFTTSGSQLMISPVQYRYDDGAGHGVLVGNQNLYWTLTSTSTSATNRINVKILYRAKRISDGEMLGIVLQSNQN